MGFMKLSFKCLLKLCIIAVVFFITLTPGRANDVKLAEAFIEKLGSNIIKVVDEEITVSEKQKKLLELFQNNANVMTIARAALGSKWRTLNAETRLDFANAFTDYLVKKYGKQFDEFRGASLVLERSVDAGKRGVLVNTRLIMPGTSPVSIKWQVWQKTDSFKLIDIIIEDISMLTMEREEIKNRLSLQNGVIKSLINDLQNPK
jgi:phospholipid transport system substrate-binding protein